MKAVNDDAGDDGDDAVPDERRYDKDEVHWTRMVGFSLRVLARHPFLLALTVITAIGVSFADVLSLGLLLPFLASLGGPAAFPSDFAFNFLLEPFEGLSLEQKIRTIAVLLVAVQLVRGGLSYITSRVASYLAVLFERHLRQMVFDDLLRVELRMIHQEKTGDLFTLMHTFPRQASKLVKDYTSGISKVVTTILLVGAMVAISWEMTVAAMVLGGLSLLVVSRIRKLVKRLGRRIRDTRMELHHASLESLQSMKVIRLFAREQHALDRFMGKVMDLQRQSFQNSSLTAAAGPLQRILNISLFAILLIGATFVLDADSGTWIMQLTVFLLVVTRLMAPLSSFANRSARIAAETPALEAVIVYLDRDKPYLKEGTKRFERLERGLRVDGVSFGYDPTMPPVLRDVSFELKRGSTVALVGESGSGKSTLIHLLSRLSDPTVGRILVDGVDLREFESATWRRRVAVVSQDTHLFNDTVRENLRFGKLDATDEELEEAARVAHAHEFIVEMENGYETRLGERGVRLSGGQAQRIAIARAVLADPDVLVLDEATSALDTGTERIVQQALEAVSRDRTVIAIAHRLSTIRNADLILVLDKGRIVERGTHDQLMTLNGAYGRLVQMQDVLGDGATIADAAEAARPAPRPERVVVSLGSARGVVRFPDGSEHVTDVHIGRDDAKVVERGITLRSGHSVASVRLNGHTWDDVDIYIKNGDGEQQRVAVREVRPKRAPEVER